jgi:Rod binding domain-containing protein
MQTSDITPISSGPHSTPEQIRKVAQEFESIFSSMMIKAMRKTVGENPLMPSSFGEDVYTDMLDNEYAKMFGTNSSLGLSDLIVRQLEQQTNPESALKELRNIGAKNNPWATDPRFMAKSTGTTGAPPSAATPQDVTSCLSKWEGLIAKASELHGVDKSLISAIVVQESGGNPRAVSPKGAKGLMQLMDTTAQNLGVTQPFSPWANISGGTKYLRALLDKFGGNERLAIASYNAGPTAVERYNGVPPYKETENYVTSVFNLKRHFDNLAAKEGQ